MLCKRTPCSACRRVAAGRLRLLRLAAASRQNQHRATRGQAVPLNLSTGSTRLSGRETASLGCQRGVTLIELMIVVAIVAILLALAAPNMQEFFVTNRLGSASNDLVAALSTARAEAIKRGATVTVRRKPSGEARTCSTKDWSCGWEVFVDANGNGARDTGDEMIRQRGNVQDPLTVKSNAELGTCIAFDSQGRAFQPTGCVAGTFYQVGGLSNLGVFVVCHGPNLAQGTRPRSRAVLLNASGRVRVVLPNSSGAITRETLTVTTTASGTTTTFATPVVSSCAP